jgi:hypothetical protein
MIFPLQRVLRMDPKENITPLLITGCCLAMDPTKERITSVLGRCLVTDPKELTPKKTPPPPSNRHTFIQSDRQTDKLSILYIDKIDQLQ